MPGMKLWLDQNLAFLSSGAWPRGAPEKISGRALNTVRLFRGWAAIRREQLPSNGASSHSDISSQTLLAYLVRVAVSFQLILTLLLCLRRLSGNLTQPLDAVTYLAVAVGLCLFTTTLRFFRRAGMLPSVEPDRRILGLTWGPLLLAVVILSAVTIQGTSALATVVGWLLVIGEPICWSYFGLNRFVPPSPSGRRSVTTRQTPHRFALPSAGWTQGSKRARSAARWAVRDRKSSPWHSRGRVNEHQHTGDAVRRRQHSTHEVRRPLTTADPTPSRVRSKRAMQTCARSQPRLQTQCIRGTEATPPAINMPVLSSEGEPLQALTSSLSSSLANAPQQGQQRRSTSTIQDAEFKPILDPTRQRRLGLEDLAAELETVPYPADQLQALIRTRMSTDVECIHGWTRGYFAAGERSINLHLAFCPPLASLPEVECNQALGPPATIKVGQAEPFGLRLEVRLDKTPAEPTEVVVEFQAVADSAPFHAESSAAESKAESQV